jgi:hypothetical protein
MPRSPDDKRPGGKRERSTARDKAPVGNKPPASRPTPPPLPPSRQIARAEARPAGKLHKPAPAFPKKNQPPTAAAFAARLPLALGKRFDLCRSYLLKVRGVREDVFFYGPESGWALRYLLAGQPLCSLHIHDERPIGIVSLAADAAAGIDWKGLSAAGQKARRQAHGSPSLLWLDVDLEGTGAGDFRTVVRAKLATLSATMSTTGAADESP